MARLPGLVVVISQEHPRFPLQEVPALESNTHIVVVSTVEQTTAKLLLAIIIFQKGTSYSCPTPFPKYSAF